MEMRQIQFLIQKTNIIQPSFRFILDGGIGSGFSNESILFADATFGSQTSPHSYFGGGFGINKFSEDPNLKMPFYLYGRLNSTKSKNQLFADIKVGYAFGYLGLFMNPSIGIRFGNKNAFNLGVGYRLQSRTSFDIQNSNIYGTWGSGTSSNITQYASIFQSIDLKIGYEI